MTPDELAIPEDLRAWLTRRHDAAPDEWKPDQPELRCDPRLVERLATLAGPLRARRVFVAGCPVIHHPSGPPIAAAVGAGDILVPGRVPGVLGARDTGFGWFAVEAWPGDVGFARGTDLLRQVVAQAFANVDA